MIELPQRFSEQDPIGPLCDAEKQQKLGHSEGLSGLAEDVRRYGDWIRNEAYERIGHLYPRIPITERLAQENATLKGHVGKELTVVCWVWARTIPSPNPSANGALVPITSTFVVGGKGASTAYVEPVINGNSYTFVMRFGAPPKEAKNGRRRGGRTNCVIPRQARSGERAGPRISPEGRAIMLATKPQRIWTLRSTDEPMCTKNNVVENMSSSNSTRKRT